MIEDQRLTYELIDIILNQDEEGYYVVQEKYTDAGVREVIRYWQSSNYTH